MTSRTDADDNKLSENKTITTGCLACVFPYSICAGKFSCGHPAAAAERLVSCKASNFSGTTASQLGSLCKLCLSCSYSILD